MDEGTRFAPRRPRLSARVAVFLLARMIWTNDHDPYDGSAWDNNLLPSAMYEKYIARAEAAVREEMDRV